jgi:hypothetical protein
VNGFYVSEMKPVKIKVVRGRHNDNSQDDEVILRESHMSIRDRGARNTQMPDSIP